MPIMLWCCLLLPSLPLEVFARAQASDDPRPFAVTTGGHYPRIVSANAAAEAAGIVPEQLVSAALALAPEIVLRDRDPAAEAAALASFAAWVTQFTPMVSLAPPAALLAEISGSLRLFGGFPRLAARLGQPERAVTGHGEHESRPQDRPGIRQRAELVAELFGEVLHETAGLVRLGVEDLRTVRTPLGLARASVKMSTRSCSYALNLARRPFRR